MAESVLLRIYLFGYGKRSLPRWLRKTIARSKLHNAWLCGFHGRFEEGGVQYGPTRPY